MKLVLNRDILNEKYTLGRMGVFIEEKEVAYFYTVEDTVRKPGVKVKAETAIPAGTYDVIVNMSTRFKKLMPLLLRVPMFTGIRIHTGNTAEHSEGCIIIGMVRTTSGVGDSRTAYKKLMDLFENNENKATIIIKNYEQFNV